MNTRFYNKQPRMIKPIVLGISAGNGVNLFPFKDHVIGNVEIRADYTIRGSAQQFALNFPESFFQKRLPHVSELFEEPNIIIGNPKCGGSSKLRLSRGKEFKTSSTEPSLELFTEAINLYQPSVFLLENLPRLLEDFPKFPGYNLIKWVGSMSEIGNSQKNRERLIVVGYLRSLPKITRIRLKKHLSIKGPSIDPLHTSELLLELPDNGHFRPPLSERIALYGGKQATYYEIQKIWEDLGPSVTRLKTPDEKFNTAPGVYRDAANKPPNTIRKSNRCFNPDGLSYTPRERARIQGIPDDFLILDPEEEFDIEEKTLFNKACITVGSTPSYEVGTWFKEALLKAKFIALKTTSN